MPKLIATHEVDDVADWLASPKRQEVFAGVATNITTFVHPRTTRTAVGGADQPGGTGSMTRKFARNTVGNLGKPADADHATEGIAMAADQHSPATCSDQATQLQSAGSGVKVDGVRV